MLDKHGHLCCDKCGVTGCGHVIDTETNRVLKASIRRIACPFGWCKEMALCVLCRGRYADFIGRQWHIENGCRDAALASQKAPPAQSETAPVPVQMGLPLVAREKKRRAKKKP